MTGGDHSEYGKFVLRVLRAYGRRVSHNDPADLAELVEVQRAVEQTIRESVQGLRDAGFSWADIGSAVGITRQAAQQRWGVSTNG